MSHRKPLMFGSASKTVVATSNLHGDGSRIPKPSLDLDFIGRSTLDSRITFTRASSGTYFDNQMILQTGATDVPRFNHSKAAGAVSITNLVLQSQTLGTTWTATRVTVIDNDALAPDGSMTMEKIVEDLDTATTYSLRQSISFTNTVVYTMSCFASADERDELHLTFPGSPFPVNPNANFDLTLGTVTAEGAGADSSGIEDVGGGIFRCWVTATADATAASTIQFHLMSAGSITYNGDGSSGLHMWGAQVEVGAVPSSYIPTTTVAVTHTAGTPLGLLLEEARTNSLKKSADLTSGADWLAIRATPTANLANGPDRLASLERLQEDGTAANTHYIQQSMSFVAASQYTLSTYAIADERDELRLWLAGTAFTTNNAAWASFDLTTGAVLTEGAHADASGIEDLGDGLFRCWVVATADTTGAANCRHMLSVADSVTYGGDNASGLFLGFSQTELGAFPTSYIATVASAVTRSADVASMLTAGWYNPERGSLLVDARILSAVPDGNGSVIQIDDGTNTERQLIQALATSADVNYFVAVTAGTQVSSTVAGAGWSVFRKVLATYRLNDFALYEAGLQQAVDTAGTLPVGITTMRIGSRLGTANFLNGHIRRFTAWKQQLSAGQGKALTQ